MLAMRANGSHCDETPSSKMSRRAFGSHYTCVSQLKVYADDDVPIETAPQYVIKNL